MANHVLNIVQGTTTVNLGYGGNHGIRRYVPVTPSADDESVTESAVILFQASSLDNLRAAVRQVEQLLSVNAPLWAEQRLGSPVYIQFDPGNTGTVYRSQVLSGRVELDEDTLGWQWWNVVCEAQLTWTRRPYWEGPETTLVNGTLIYNHDDSGHDNYVTVSSVGGNLPAPIRVEMKNEEADSTGTVWVGLNKFHNPTSLVTFLEAENANGKTGTADFTCSNGYYEPVTLPVSEGDLLVWNIDPDDYQGGYYRVLIRLRSAAPSGTYVKLCLSQTWPNVLWSMSDFVALNTTERIQEIGTVQISPFLVGQASQAGVNLRLRGYRSAGGTLEVDFIALIPMDGFRKYSVVGSALASTYRLVDDGISDPPAVYTCTDAGANRKPDYVASGTPLLLQPGTDQRLHFLQLKSDGTATITRALRVYVYYRPRRLTL
jgi:hypothetical protein